MNFLYIPLIVKGIEPPAWVLHTKIASAYLVRSFAIAIGLALIKCVVEIV